MQEQAHLQLYKDDPCLHVKGSASPGAPSPKSKRTPLNGDMFGLHFFRMVFSLLSSEF